MVEKKPATTNDKKFDWRPVVLWGVSGAVTAAVGAVVREWVKSRWGI